MLISIKEPAVFVTFSMWFLIGVKVYFFVLLYTEQTLSLPMTSAIQHCKVCYEELRVVF